jgi:thiamine-phosphate pyrophosphorylase
VTDRRSLPVDASVDARVAIRRKIESLLSVGIDWVQIREKDLTAKEVSSLVRDSLLAADRHVKQGSQGARILVNDRLDVALADGAGGVHLGEKSLPVRDAKLFLQTRSSRKDFLVGVSCHSMEAAKVAADEGAAYVFFGPVFATPSKAAFGSPQGIEKLAQVCRSVSIPVLAIGGITVENAPECLAAGAAGIAAIRLFQDSLDPAETIRALREARG